MASGPPMGAPVPAQVSPFEKAMDDLNTLLVDVNIQGLPGLPTDDKKVERITEINKIIAAIKNQNFEINIQVFQDIVEFMKLQHESRITAASKTLIAKIQTETTPEELSASLKKAIANSPANNSLSVAFDDPKNFMSENADSPLSKEGNSAVTTFMTNLNNKLPARGLGSEFSNDLNKIKDISQRVAAIAILRSIGIQNLNYDTTKYVIKNAKALSKKATEICEVFKKMETKGIKVVGLRQPIMKLALENPQGFNNFNTFLDHTHFPTKLNKDEMKSILKHMKTWKTEPGSTRAEDLGKCIQIMKDNGIRLTSMRDFPNKLEKLMTLNESQLKCMAGALEGIKTHPDFKEDPNDMFNHIHAALAKRDIKAKDAVEHAKELESFFKNHTNTPPKIRLTDHHMGLSVNVNSILNADLNGLKAINTLLTGLKENPQFKKDPNDTCAEILDNLNAVGRNVSPQHPDKDFPAQLETNIQCISRCMAVMGDNDIPFQQSLVENKLGRIMQLPQAQLRVAADLMDKMDEAGAFKKDPKEGFEALMNSVEAITKSPERTELLKTVLDNIAEKEIPLTNTIRHGDNIEKLMKLDESQLRALDQQLHYHFGPMTPAELSEKIETAKSHPMAAPMSESPAMAAPVDNDPRQPRPV